MSGDPRPGFRRRISPSERLYLAGLRLSPPFALQVFVEGEGAIKLEELRHAVERASAACPGARLVRRGRWWVDSGQAPAVRELEEAGFDGYDFERAAFTREPLDPKKGPTCEVLLLRGTPPRLVFRAFHGVMDGQGVLLWLKDVFRVLRGEEPEGAGSGQTDHSLLRATGRPARRPRVDFDCVSPLAGAGVDDTAFFWRRRTVPGRHPALVARLAARLAAELDDGRGRYMVPVDLRRHDEGPPSTANLSLPIFLEAERGESWETLQERLVAALAARSELAADGTEGVVSALPTGLLLVALRRLLAKQRRRGRYLGSAILSHLGRVELAACSCPGFAARAVYSLPVHAPLSPLTLVTVENDRHLELTLAAPRGEGQEARADALLERLAAALDRSVARVAGPTVDFAREGTVVEQLATVARACPEATALVEGERRLTHGALDRDAERIARALARQGVGRGSVVGLLANRTLEAVSAILGILKCGAAWLPLEPRQPVERLRYLLVDSGAALCLTSAEHARRLEGAPFAGTVVPLENLGDAEGAPQPASVGGPWPEAPRLSDRAYLIYTSGSTGRPKGVELEHESLANYVGWARRAYQATDRTRFALFTSLAFDLSITSLFVPLVAGGSVALFPGELDHRLLEDVVARAGATALKLTPTHLALIEQLDLQPRGIDTLVVGGEAFTSGLAARAQTRFGATCRILNEYGPTEATVGCIVHRFDAEKDAGGESVPIGRPIANTQVALLDADGAPVSREACGELVLAGRGLARGYVNATEADRARFVTLADGARAYRSGDLARWSEERGFEYVGRADEQVKLRGYRIEPAEVEAALEAHPAVERAVVRGRPRGPEVALCAWVVLREPTSDEALRVWLAERLPPAMLPGCFVRLETLPLTVNGKVDLAALPDPALPASAEVRDPTRRDAVEAAVVEIWARALSLDAARLDARADFYALGGDSLGVVAMLAEVARRVVGLEREAAFMHQVRPMMARPTFDGVCRVARRLLAAEPGAS